MTASSFPAGATMVFGATGGIGRGVAEYFADSGSDVALCYHTKSDTAEHVAERIRTQGRVASVHRVDVTDLEKVREAVADALAVHGRIHTVVWAAGPVAEQYSVFDTPEDMWRRAIDVETHGFFAMTRAVLPVLRRSGGGSIVALGSAGHTSWPAGDVLSVVPKAANEALITGIAKEEGRHGIRANSILVGVINAGMFRELSERGVFDDDWTEQTLGLLAVKRWGEPEEIGHAAVFLATNEYVTGQRISVSGGFGL